MCTCKCDLEYRLSTAVDALEKALGPDGPIGSFGMPWVSDDLACEVEFTLATFGCFPDRPTRKSIAAKIAEELRGIADEIERAGRRGAAR